MRTLLLLPFLFLFFHSRQAQAQPQTNLYVDSSVAASGAGTSWATAYKTLNAANGGSTTISYNVFVAKGTYYPPGTQSATARDSAFAFLRNGLRVYGGYQSGGSVRNVAANATVLSGDIGVAGDSTDNAYHVVVMANISGAGDSAILDGLSIINGQAPLGSGSKVYGGKTANNSDGGGVWIGFTGINTLLRNCAVRNNTGYNGGGIYYTEANTGFENTVFSGNRAQSGGAIYQYRPYIHFLTNCTFTQNYAVVNGGAVYMNGNGYPTFRGCAFNQNATSNAAGAGGGAVYSFYTNFYCKVCTFSQNTSRTGGAVFVTGGAYIATDTCSFIGNRALAGDGGAVNGTNATFTGVYCKNTVFNANTALLGKGGAVASFSTSLDTCTFSADSAL